MTLPATRVFDTPEILIRTLADTLLRQAAAAIAAHGRFHLVLAGGNTPRALYAELAARGTGDGKWHIWYGDERCLPANHPERNSVMSETAWLAASSIPPVNRRPIPAELGAAEAAARYTGWLKDTADFDVVLLGMGEDGHTASLFPGHDWGDAPASPDVLAVIDAPKPPPERVSLSAARLNRSRHVWFVVTGAGKREALLRWKRGEKLPVSAVRSSEETVVWLDQAAWSADK